MWGGGWGRYNQSLRTELVGLQPNRHNVLLDREVGHFQFSECVLLKQWHFSLQARVIFKIINKDKATMP